MNIYANRILKAPRVFLLATDDVTSESSQPFEFSQSSGSSPYEIETKRKLPIQLQFNNSNDITASNSTRAQGVYQCHSRSIARLRHSSPAKEGNSLSSINHSGRHKSDPSPIFHSPSPLGIYRSGRKRRIIENDEAIWNSQFGNTPIIASAKSLKSISSRLSSVSEDLKLADFCCACLQEDSSDDDPIILCDGRCGQSVHLSCFGLKEVPTGKFYCDGCSYDNLRSEYVIQRSRCYLCNRSEGFLCKIIEHKNNPKLKPSDQFVHLICVLFINELTLDPDSLKPNNLLHLDKERKDLFCNMCKRKGLGVAQCTYGNCMQSSHPYCCFSFPSCSTLAEDEEKRWSLVILEKSNNADFESSIRYELYCPRHVNKIPNDCIVSFQGRLPEKNTFQSIDETASNCVSKKIVSFQQDSNDNEDLSNVKYSKRLRKAGALVAIDKHLRGGISDAIREYRRNVVRNYFDEEAQLSGESNQDSASDDSENSECLSGDFINDGSFTQHEDAKEEGYALYLNIDRMHEEMLTQMSPSATPQLKFRGAEAGLPIITRLLRQDRKRNKNSF